MIEFEHSPLGGSGATRWMTCGNSFLLQRLLMVHEEYEEPLTSVFADKGNAAHELGADCLKNNLEPFEFIGKKYGNYVVHPADLDPNAVAVYVAFCEAIIDEAKGAGQIMVEETIHLPQIHPLFKGTVDFAHWRFTNNPVLKIVDYKNGEGIGVSVVKNKQLMYYAVLLILSVPELKLAPKDFPVHLSVVQPNYFGLFDEPETWETTIGEILQWAHDELMPTMHKLLADKRDMLPEDEFISGDHCQFCPVMLDCPKLRRSYETYATSDEFTDMLSDEEVSTLYGMRQEARYFGNQLEKVAFARKIAGRPITTAKIVETRVHRVWKGGAEDAAKKQFGENAYAPKKLKSPAQMEKLSSNGKAFAIEYGFKPDSERLTLAPLSDPRSEATPRSNEVVFAKFATPIEDLGW